MASAKWDCNDWTAFHDHMPGKPQTLRVSGTCEMPTTGYEGKLRRIEPQGFNPKDLRLELMISDPSGGVSEVITPIQVTYEEQTDMEYDTVSIDGYATVEVQCVH
jgi:hypothetical protein